MLFRRTFGVCSLQETPKVLDEMVRLAAAAQALLEAHKALEDELAHEKGAGFGEF